MLSRAIRSTVRNYGRSMSTYPTTVFPLVKNDIIHSKYSNYGLIKCLTINEASELLRVQETIVPNIIGWEIRRKEEFKGLMGMHYFVSLLSIPQYFFHFGIVGGIVHNLIMGHTVSPSVFLVSLFLTPVSVGVTIINYYTFVPAKLQIQLHSAIYRYKLKKVIEKCNRV